MDEHTSAHDPARDDHEASGIGAVPHGARRTVPITGSDFEGPRLRGSVLPGASADWLLLRADGVLELDLRATLRTDDGGLTWVRVPANVLWRSPDESGYIDSLDFVDEKNGFAMRRKLGDVANPYTQWLSTTGGGRTWTVVVEAPRTP